MENKAHYALIGTFVLLALIGIVAFITFLAGRSFDQNTDRYIVEFEGPIRGISVGGEVKYSGIKVGEIKAVRLDKANPQLVLVDIEVQEDTPIYVGSYAQLEPQGLTGLNYIQLFAGRSQKKLMKNLPSPPPYVIRATASQIDTLLDGGASVMNNAGETLDRLSMALSDDAIQDFRGILKNLNTITEELAQSGMTGERLSNILTSMEQAGADISIVTGNIASLVNDVKSGTLGDINAFVARLTTSLESVDGAFNKMGDLATSATSTVIEIQNSVRDISQSGLSDLKDATAEFRRLAETLNRIADELERNPSAFIVGTEKPVVRLPQ